MLLALYRRSRPSFILFRESDIVRAADYAARIRGFCLNWRPISMPDVS
jgi:hypothetical protein